MRPPQTQAEWIEAVQLAAFSLTLHKASVRGYITGVTVDRKHCEWTIEEARKRGIVCVAPEIKLLPAEAARA